MISRHPVRKILILTANPRRTSSLRLDEEVREIDAGLRRARKRDQFVLEQRWAVRPRDIRRAILDVEPQIVHFSGHGAGDEGLVFENETGQGKLVDAGALADLFRLFADQVECVVLNACYSEVQAEAITQHISYVIGMHRAIGDVAAIEFAIGFYDALGAGRSIEFAYQIGCNAIQMAGIQGHLTPILKRRTSSNGTTAQIPLCEESQTLAHQDISLALETEPVEVFSSYSHEGEQFEADSRSAKSKINASSEAIVRDLVPQEHFGQQITKAYIPLSWDDGLEGTVRHIAETNHSPLRVLAGPGTGKTFALKRRLARLLQSGVSPSRILVCTFTRTAANDLQEAVSVLGIEVAKAVHAGTLHAYCFSLLSRADILRLTGRVPRPLLEFEQRFLLEDLRDTTLGGVNNCRDLLKAFNAAWARSQVDQPGWAASTIDQAFHDKLKNWLYFHEAILIGELVPETLRYLRDNPASEDRQAFDHILVDEYQDLNRAEQDLLNLMAESGALAVIGDEDQSIYSFKYAHPEGIANFNDYHPNTLDASLHVCYRCPSLVVEMANHLISHNRNRLPRRLQPFSGNPEGEVYVVQWNNTQQEADGIAHFIHKRVRDGHVEPGKVLILAPRRQFGYAVRDALNNIGISAHSFFQEETLDGDPKSLAGCKAQQAFALLTLLSNPEDRVALRCWCGFGSNSLRSGAWQRLREHCEQSGESPRIALERLVSGTLRISRSGDLIARFKQLKEKLSELRGLYGLDLVNNLFPTCDDWAVSLNQMATSAEATNLDASKLLELLRIGVAQPELPKDVDYVRVMSLHKSKGLEADLVIVVGCVQGIIPYVDDELSRFEQIRGLEEQRRLFYVAITRTKRILVLSGATQLPRHDAHRMQAPFTRGSRTNANMLASSFLSELGPLKPNPIAGDAFLRAQ